jgi:predicted nucleic acid-binding protein
MNTILVDIVALLALWNELDQWHEAAEAAFALAYHTHSPLITTSCVLLECGNAVARKDYRDAVLYLRLRLQKSSGLFEPLPEEIENAWEAFERRDANSAGMVDLISFEVMRRLQITQALTNDDHFRAAGFETLM